MSKLRFALAISTLALISAHARAMTCSFTNVVGVSFGGYSILDPSPLDSTGSVSYLCTGGSASTVTIDISTGSSSSYAARTLQKGADTLDYNLYLSAARTGSVWGDGAGGTTHYGPVMVELDVEATVTVYGRIAAMQNAAAGNYADTVVVTINY